MFLILAGNDDIRVSRPISRGSFDNVNLIAAGRRDARRMNLCCIAT